MWGEISEGKEVSQNDKSHFFTRHTHILSAMKTITTGLHNSSDSNLFKDVPLQLF